MERDSQRSQIQQPQQQIVKPQEGPPVLVGQNPVEDKSQGGKNSGNNNNSATNENSRSVGKRKYTKRAKPNKDSLSQGSGNGGGKDRRQGRWSREEKQKFIDALNIYGKDWKKVELHIKTRSGAQIRSHAQKFFMNIQRSHGMDIDAYVKFLQSGEGKNHLDLTENTLHADDSGDEDRLVTTNTIQHSGLLDGGTNAANDESQGYTDFAKKEKQIIVSEIESSQQRQEASISDVSAGQRVVGLSDQEKTKQFLLNQLKNQQQLAQKGTAAMRMDQLMSAEQLLSQVNSSTSQRKQFDMNDPNLLLQMTEHMNKFQSFKQFDDNASNQASQRKLKLSPSKLHTQTKNVQNLRTARWANQANPSSSQNSPNDPKMSHENSPQKIPICEDTWLSIRNINVRNTVQFEDVWKLINQRSGTKHNYSQMYSDRLYQQYLDLPNIMQIPDVIIALKNEVEEIEQIFNMDAIKVDWHFNKNELFVNDFKDKLYERKPNGAIIILNLFEKSLQSNKTQKARIRNMQTKQLINIKDLVLQNGTVITLKGNNVNNLSYEVPKVASRISEQIGKRITLTFYQLSPIQRSSSQHFNEQSPVQMAVNGKTPSFGKQRFPPNQLNMGYGIGMDRFFNLGNLQDNTLFQMSNQSQKKLIPNNYSIDNLLSNSFNKFGNLMNQPGIGTQSRQGGQGRDRAYSGFQDSVQASNNKTKKYNEQDLQQLRDLLTKRSEKPSPKPELSLNHSIMVSRKNSPQESSNSYNIQNQFSNRPGLSQKLQEHNQKQLMKFPKNVSMGSQLINTPRQKNKQGNVMYNDKIKSLIQILTQGGKQQNPQHGGQQTQRTGEASPISQVSRQNLNNMLGDASKSPFQSHNQQQMKNNMSMNYNNNQQKQASFLRKALGHNIKVTEPSGTPSEHQHNPKGGDDAKDFQHLIKAMMSGKGPSFPQRGISEISGRSGFSIGPGPLIDRKFQHHQFFQKAQTQRFQQKDSGETVRKDPYQVQLGSRRQSQNSGYSSFLGAQAMVGDQHTSNDAKDHPIAEVGKPNPSELNEQTLQSVQQMLNQQCIKQVSKLIDGTPQKLAANDFQPSITETQPINPTVMSQKKIPSHVSSNLIKDHPEDIKNSNHISEFSEVIKCIETKKNFLYFNFIINIGKHFQNVQDKEQQQNAAAQEGASGTGNQPKDSNLLSAAAVDFLQSYNDMYVQIQEKQLKLFMKALMFYSENEKQNQNNSLLRLQKNKIDNSIIKNMVETLNIQILIKIVLQMYEKLKQKNLIQDGEPPLAPASDPNIQMLSIDQISPIKMDFFQQLIPQSYTQELNENYQKSAISLQKLQEKEKNANQEEVFLGKGSHDFELKAAAVGGKAPQLDQKQQQKTSMKKDMTNNAAMACEQQDEQLSLHALKKSQGLSSLSKIKPGVTSKNTTERRLFEKDSDNSMEAGGSALKKREAKNAKKQLLMMLQSLNPESNNIEDVKKLNMPKIMNNQGDQFSFNTNISPNNLEPIKAMKQISFQPTNLQLEPNKEGAQMVKEDEAMNIDNTFKKIAQSLSPEPEKLIKQSQANDQLQSKKMELQVEIIKQLVGQKRAAKKNTDVVGADPSIEMSKKRQKVLNQTPEPNKESNEESADQDFKSVIQYLQEELGDDFNIEQLIQSLMTQNKDLNSQMREMSQLLQDPKLTQIDEGVLRDNNINFENLIQEELNNQAANDSEEEIRRRVLENSRGVRAGGFRQAAYSDNHQEMAAFKTNGLSHDIQEMIVDPQDDQLQRLVDGQDHLTGPNKILQEQALNQVLHQQKNDAQNNALDNFYNDCEAPQNKVYESKLDGGNSHQPQHQQPQDQNKKPMSPEKIFKIDKGGMGSSQQRTPPKVTNPVELLSPKQTLGQQDLNMSNQDHQQQQQQNDGKC